MKGSEHGLRLSLHGLPQCRLPVPSRTCLKKFRCMCDQMAAFAVKAFARARVGQDNHSKTGIKSPCPCPCPQALTLHQIHPACISPPANLQTLYR